MVTHSGKPSGETIKQWLDREMLYSANQGLETILDLRHFSPSSFESRYLQQELARERFIGACYLRIHDIYQRAYTPSLKK